MKHFYIWFVFMLAMFTAAGCVVRFDAGNVHRGRLCSPYHRGDRGGR